MTPILTLKGISKTYPGVKALENVDFQLTAGEVRVLLGKNGAGKSTLVKILSGAAQPDSGTIYLQNREVTFHAPQDAFREGICTVYQEMSLVPGLTVSENILLGRWPTRRRFGLTTIDRPKIRAIARQALEQLEVNLDLDEKVSRLNIAQQQLTEIAKAISFDPLVLMLDEPTSALAQHEVELLHNVVRRLAERGRAIIYVTHRLQEIARVADSVTVLRDGRHIGTIPVEEATPDRIAVMMIGTEWARSEREQMAVLAGETRLKVIGLSQGSKLHDISFELRAGEVVGIAGLLGSGRTELLRAIFGLDPFDKGEIYVDGVRVEHPNPLMMKQRGVAFTPEDRKRQGLVLPFTVRNNLTLAGLDRVSSGGILDPKQEAQIAERMVDKMSVKTASLDVKTRTLSGGNQQKVVIGNWLNTQPKVLMMDEPTRGIDIQAKEQIFRLVRTLARQGLAVLFVSSEIEEVLDVADRILILSQGRITGEVSANNITIEQLIAMVLEDSYGVAEF
jgi:ribose transport system ATP-binding protein